MNRRSFLKLISASFASTPLLGLATQDKITKDEYNSIMSQIINIEED
jgi:hypothetical protein